MMLYLAEGRPLVFVDFSFFVVRRQVKVVAHEARRRRELSNLVQSGATGVPDAN